LNWTQRLALGVTHNTPLLLQTEAAECGLACLAMVLGHHGLQTDLPAMRARHRVALTGLTLADLATMAHQENMGTRALRLDIEELAQLRLPAILHWDMNHFVVLKSVGPQRVVVLDPAFGERRLDLQELAQHFTGVALELWPDPGFAPKVEKTRVRLSQMIGQVTGFWPALSQVLLLSLALEVFALVTPLYMQWVLDHVVVSRDMPLLTTLAIGFGLLLVVQQGASLLRSWLLMAFGTTLSVQWKSNVFSHLTRLPLAYFQSRHLGDIVSRAESVDEIQGTLTTTFVEAVFDGLLVVLTLVLMYLYSPQLTLVAVLAILIYLAIRLLWYRPLYAATEESIVRGARQSSHFLETVRGMRAIQLFGRQDERRSAWQTLLVSTTNAGLRLEKYRIFYGLMRDLLSGAVAIVVVWLGVRQVMDATLSVGMLMAFIAYRTQFDGRVTGLIDKVIELRMLRLQAERLADIVLTPAQAPSPRHPLRHIGEQEAPPPTPPLIEFQDVHFRYADQSPWVLEHLNLRIEPGEVLAITGRSGGGKTTLVNLLLGTYMPEGGQICIDGRPLVQRDMGPWRNRIATVMQDDSLFAGSVADNICFFDARPDLERIVHCARLAALDDEIEMMPMAYQTLIGDMGTALSGGQKQRLLLARALYKQPNVLILDEATSQLDVQAESRVNAAIGALNMTRIIVAHRAETIAAAHRVVMIEEGRVAFAGDPGAYFEHTGQRPWVPAR